MTDAAAQERAPPTRAQAEARVEAHSASLKKELGVRDLALTQILFIVGLTWIGVAGKLGPSHVVFWLLALVLFYLPSAAVVIYLNRLMPLEGGLYQWAKLGFNQTVGFMLAWNLWLYVIVFTSEIGLQCATYLSYAIGPSAAWMTSSSWFVALSSALILSLMVVTSTIGLSVGKWVHNTGGIFMITIFGAVVLLPVIGLLTGTLAEYHPFRTHLPELSLYNLNILGKMGFGALGGFEYMAILAGETRAPARSVTRSVFIAAPVIALMFVLGTSAVVAYVPNTDIDLIGPVAQVLRIGYGPFGIAAPLVTIAILMTLAMRVGQASVAFTAVTRLPMVAGWDHMLPAWFSRLHATYKTPVNSIMLVGASSFGIASLSLIGVGQAEAFQLVFNASGIFYALTYVVMFAIPLFGLRTVTPGPPMWLRLASLSGLLMTVLYIVLSVFPIIEVKSAGAFAFKISSVIVVMNLVGVGILVGRSGAYRGITGSRTRDGCCAVVQHPLPRAHELRLPLVVAAGVEVAVVLRERRRRHRHAQPMPRRNDDPRVPHVDLVFVDRARREQLRLVESLAEPRARDAVLDAHHAAVRIDIEQHHVPVRVERVGGGKERGAHGAGDLHRLRERRRCEREQVVARRVDLRVILVQAQLELARVDQVGRRLARIVRERVRRLRLGRERVERAVARAAVRLAARVDVEVGPLGAREREFLLLAPRVVAHDEDVDGRLPIHAVVDALEVVVEPAELQHARVDARLRAEAAVHVVDALVRAGIHEEALEGLRVQRRRSPCSCGSCRAHRRTSRRCRAPAP